MPGLRQTMLGQETLVGSWRALARLSPDAHVVKRPAYVAAVFPSWAPLNNAILLTRGDTAARHAVIDVDALFGRFGVDTYAVWLAGPATNLDAPDQVAVLAGLTRDTTTLVMHAALRADHRIDPCVVRTSIAAATTAGGDEPIPRHDLPPPDGVTGLDAWVLVDDGLAVAGAWSYRHGSDCGIYAIGTHPDWRRRGLARRLVEHVLASARRGGARTATLQSTRMGRPLYDALGFRPVGRYEEWVPTPHHTVTEESA